MSSILDARPLMDAVDAIGRWLASSLVYGTALALITALVIRFALPRCRPALKGGLWLLVLIKFVLPTGPALTWSAATGTRAVQDWLFVDRARPLAPADSMLEIALIPVDASAPALAPATLALSPEAPLRRAPLALIAAYLAALIALMGVRTRAYWKFAAACRALPSAPPSVLGLVRQVCARMHVRPIRDVRISDAAPAPFILGLWRPVLVLSTRQLDDASELEAVVLHEAAHLRRGDLWVRWLQWLAGTLLFFWPVVAWVNRRLDLIRELSCDEWALRHGRLSNGQYARCLLKALAPAPVRVGAWQPAAMASSLSTVERRIEMIMQQSGPRRSGRAMTILSASLLAAWSMFVLGGAKANPNAPAEEVKPAPQGQDAKQVEVRVIRDGDEETRDLIIDGEPVPWPQDAEGLDFDWPIFLGDEAFGLLPMVQGGAHLMVNGEGAGVGGRARVLAWRHDGEGFPRVPADFMTEHPTADVNGDGQVSREEFTAYHVAVAMKDPAAVLEKYPRADRNHNGTLEPVEAAAILIRPPMLAHFAMLHGDVVGADAMEGAPVAAEAALPVGFKVIQSEDGQEGGEFRIEVQIETSDDAETEGAESDRPVHRMIIRHGEGEEQEIELSGSEGPVAAEGGLAVGEGGIVAFGDRPPFASAADWLRTTIVFQPKSRDVARHLDTYEDARTVLFLEQHPDADANKDGKVSDEERKAAAEKNRKSALQRMKELHARMLEQHPEWDTNKDGELTREEVQAGLHGTAAGGGMHPVRARKALPERPETSPPQGEVAPVAPPAPPVKD